MSKVSESILRGAKEALAYMRGNKKGTKTHQVNVPHAHTPYCWNHPDSTCYLKIRRK